MVGFNARYLDALALLLRGKNQPVSKDRFLGEVWSSTLFTEEALIKCIRTLHK